MQKFKLPVKPTVSKITVERILDEDPDLSYLQQDYLENSVTPAQRTEYIQRDQERLSSYGSSWVCIGIRARAEYLIPNGNYSIIQTLNSGGLWGIESDSGEPYLKEIEQEQISELKEYCKTMHIEIPDNVEIEYKNE